MIISVAVFIMPFAAAVSAEMPPANTGKAMSLAGPELKLQVSPDREMGAINPRVFGATLIAKNVSFREKTTDRASALRNLSESGLRLLRYPGGFVFSRKDTRECWSNFYWQDQIGQNKDGNPLNFYDLDTFLGFCESQRIEPLMQINVIGEPEQSVEDYVSYLTAASGPWALKRAANGHPKPYAIKIWELGNELHDENQGFKGDADGARAYAAKVNTLVPKLRRQAPGSEIMLPYINVQRPVSETGDKINLDSSAAFASTFLSELKVPVDFLDWHFYAANGWGTWKYVGTDVEWKHYYCWGTKFRECYAVIVDKIRSQYTMKPYPKLFVGEWSGDWTTDMFHGNAEAPRGSMEGRMASGIYLGDILLFLMRESVPSGFIGGACWHTACGGSQSLFWLKTNPINAYNSNDASGLRPPVYWIFKLLSERRGETLVHSQLSGDNSVAAPKDGLYVDPEFKFQRVVECSTRSGDKLYIALLNKDANETVSVSIGIDSWPVLPEYGVHTVSANSYLDRNTPEKPDAIKIVSGTITKPDGASLSYKLPPNTLAVLEFTRKRNGW